jgi:hypothetical protein
MLLAVVDDSALDTSGTGPFGERLGLFLDSLPAVAIDTCRGCKVGLYSSSLTYSSQVFDFPFAAAGTELHQLRFSYYDKYLGGFTGGTGEYDYGLAHSQLRIEVERLTSGPQVHIEMLLPWALFGLSTSSELPLDTIEGIVPRAGGRSAFSVWYVDNDTSRNDSTIICWTGYSPWDGVYWADIVFGPGFPAVPTPAESLLAAVAPVRGNGAIRPASVSLDPAFSLTGRRVTGSDVFGPGVPSVRVVGDNKQGMGRVVVRYSDCPNR